VTCRCNSDCLMCWWAGPDLRKVAVSHNSLAGTGEAAVCAAAMVWARILVLIGTC
jgi:hypothetical protein